MIEKDEQKNVRVIGVWRSLAFGEVIEDCKEVSVDEEVNRSVGEVTVYE